MGVEASVVVEFGESVTDTGGTVVIELDDENSNNLNSEGEVKSTFLPEEQPVFIINHSDDLIVSDVRCTDGSIAQTGSNQLRSREEDVLFTKINEDTSLKYAGVDSANFSWRGNTGYVSVSDSVLKLESGTYPCAGTTSFNVLFQKEYMLTPPVLDLGPDESYEITVVVYMEAA